MLNIHKYIPNLVPLYNEPHRSYHSLKHIHSLMRMIEKRTYLTTIDPERTRNLILGGDTLQNAMAKSPFFRKFTDNTLEFTAWFHDCYYDPYLGSPLNEWHSGKIFESMILPDIDKINTAHYSLYETVSAAICYTGKHLEDISKTCEDIQTLIFMDLDMHGFCDASEYARNNVSVREEYYATSLEEYLPKRKWFLETLLKKERIYYLYADQHEEAARKNIEASIAILNKGLCDF